jgi:hypothetical protein
MAEVVAMQPGLIGGSRYADMSGVTQIESLYRLSVNPRAARDKRRADIG